jgi:large subunit ribosomal protein L25
MATKHIQLTAAKREGSGKGAARAVRRENLIPAVIYGDNKPATLISIEVKPVSMEYQKGHLFTALCDMTVDGAKHKVIARDLQLDPVSDKILHVDFLRVTEKTLLRVEVPLHFIGHDACNALKDGATLSVLQHEVTLRCPVNNIPDAVTIDLSGKTVGHSFKLSDIIMPAGVKPAASKPETVTVAALPASRSMADDAATASPSAAAVPASKVAAPAKAAAPAAAPKKDAKKK